MTVCALHVFVPVDNSVIFGEAWSTLDIFQGDIFVSRLDGCDDSSSCVIYIVAIDRHRFLTYQIARGINTFLWRKIDFFLKHFRSNILRKEEKLEKSRSFFFYGCHRCFVFRFSRVVLGWSTDARNGGENGWNVSHAISSRAKSCFTRKLEY